MGGPRRGAPDGPLPEGARAALEAAEGLGVRADDASAGGPSPDGHRIVHPTRRMAFDEFAEKFVAGLPREYGGKR